MKKLLLLVPLFSSVALCQILWSGPPDSFKEKILNRNLKLGKLIVSMRQDTPHFYPEGTQVSTRVWQEIYGCSNGVVVLEKTVECVFHPAVETPEKIDWSQ